MTSPARPDRRTRGAADPTAFHVRRAAAADVPAIVDAFTAVVEERRWLATEPGFDRDARIARMAAAAGDASAGMFLAEPAEAGAPSAPVVGEIGITLAPYGVAELGMFVADGWRGRGVGGALLDAAVAWARAAGAHKVALQVWPDNEAALALYRGRGFEQEGLLRRHYRRADGSRRDAVVMGLLLDDGDGA